MDKREQLKFVIMVMSMTSCVAYSFGLFKLPTFSIYRRNQPTILEEKSRDHRNDGGTGSRMITKKDLTLKDRIALLRNSEWVVLDSLLILIKCLSVNVLSRSPPVIALLMKLDITLDRVRLYFSNKIIVYTNSLILVDLGLELHSHTLVPLPLSAQKL